MQGANQQLCPSGSRASGQFSTASRRLGPPGPWHPLHQPGWVLESQGGSRPAAPTGAVQRPPAPNPPGRLHVQACSPPLQRARRSGVGGVSGWAGPAGYVGAGRPGLGSRACPRAGGSSAEGGIHTRTHPCAPRDPRGDLPASPAARPARAKGEKLSSRGPVSSPPRERGAVLGTAGRIRNAALAARPAKVGSGTTTGRYQMKLFHIYIMISFGINLPSLRNRGPGLSRSLSASSGLFRFLFFVSRLCFGLFRFLSSFFVSLF